MTLNIFTQAIYSLRYPRIGNSTLEPGEKVLSEIIYILRSLVKTLQTNIAKKKEKKGTKLSVKYTAFILKKSVIRNRLHVQIIGSTPANKYCQKQTIFSVKYTAFITFSSLS